jgi:Mg-chelatase subunit ChlD
MALLTETTANTAERWASALEELKRETRIEERPFSINLVIVIDNSGSMAGKRINAVKIGLCCLLASLQPKDRVHLMSFNSELCDLSGGPVNVESISARLPAMLSAIRAEGGTSFYDAVLHGIEKTSALSALSTPDSNDRNVLLCLTDGEDTQSNASAVAVSRSCSDNMQTHLCLHALIVVTDVLRQ